MKLYRARRTDIHVKGKSEVQTKTFLNQKTFLNNTLYAVSFQAPVAKIPFLCLCPSLIWYQYMQC